MDVFAVVFACVWVTVVATMALYLYVLVALRIKYPELWRRLFWHGFANVSFWIWVSDNKFAEITDPSLKRVLILLNRLTWLSVSAGGIIVTGGIIWSIWKVSEI